jgi:hypothetical protein
MSHYETLLTYLNRLNEQEVSWDVMEECQNAVLGVLQQEPELLEPFYSYVMASHSETLAEVFVNTFRDLPFKKENLVYLHTLLTEPWHTMYEDMVHMLQRYKDPSSIPVLKQTMYTRFPYPESYGTGTPQLINQCRHALLSINTKEALDVIDEFYKSEYWENLPGKFE